MNSIRSGKRVSSAFVLKSVPALMVLTALAACSGTSTNVTPENGTPTGSAISAPTLTLKSDASTVPMGHSATLQWSSANAASCTASGGWSGSQPPSGTMITPPLTTATSYVLSCVGSGGTATQSVDIGITAPSGTVTLTASPTTVASGGSSTLTWNAPGATSCAASGGWSGAVGIKGSQATGALKASTVYTLSCTGPGGTISQNTTVSVTAASTGTATLSWNAPTTNTDGTPVTALAGYHIYYGASEGAMTLSVAANGAAATSYEITGLTAGTWYFSVAADAADGAEGPPSDIGSKTI